MKCILQNKASTSFFHLGWINTFLSWPGFVPLSRISYIIYLMHFATINVLEGPVYYQKDASNTVMVCVKFINNDKIRHIGKFSTFFYVDHVFSHCVVFYVNRICNHLCMHRNAMAEYGKAYFYHHFGEE